MGLHAWPKCLGPSILDYIILSRFQIIDIDKDLLGFYLIHLIKSWIVSDTV